MTNKSKIALVTDAEHFVGIPTLVALLKAGFTCLAVDDSFAEESARTAFEDRMTGVTALAPQAPAALIATIEARFGRLDALISSDGHPAEKLIYFEEELSVLDTKFQQALDAMVTRPFSLITAASRLMQTSGGGRIVVASSAAPMRGLVNYPVYAAVRGAQNGLIKTLSLEMGPHNITINALGFNFIKSPTYFPDRLISDPGILAKITKNIPVGRLGEPSEAGETIAFLCGEHGGFITGQVIPFAGGWA